MVTLAPRVSTDRFARGEIDEEKYRRRLDAFRASRSAPKR